MTAALSNPEPFVAFTKVQRRRVFEDICDQVRRKLARGEYKPGDKLPSERELAAELGVGRPAVREALRTLENSGVLLLKKGLKGGAFVRQGDPQVLTQSLHDLVHLGHIALPDLMEARIVLTGSVLRLACARGTEQEFDAIEACIDLTERLEKSGDYAQRVQVATEFFRLIAVASHNSVLMLLVDSLTVIVRYARTQIYVLPTSDPQIQLRRDILACMRKHDVAGAHAKLDRFFDLLQSELERAKFPQPAATAPRTPAAA